MANRATEAAALEAIMGKIVWRKDIANAPKDRRVLMIAMALPLNHIEERPDIVVAHWHEQNEHWVAIEIQLRPLAMEDFKG